VRAYLSLGNRFITGMYQGFARRAAELGMAVDPVLHVSEGVDLSQDPHDVAPMPPPVHEDQVCVWFNPSPFRPYPVQPGCIVSIVTTADELPPAMSTTRYDVVTIDQEMGGRLAGEALRRAGCRDVFFVGVAAADDRGHRGYRLTSARRLLGFESGWGQPIGPQHLAYASAYGLPLGMPICSQWFALSPRPQGVFCASDELAAGFALRAALHGLTVGKDFHLIGFDGQERIRDLLGFALPSVQVPTLEMGARAADLLHDRLQDPDRHVQRLLVNCTLGSGL
jgi:DNA-binding LacI/PurR family transcriptional regulator